MLQSTKLKPIVLGVGPYGIMRVDPKTKEVLDSWDYQVLRNWAYSRKTFVLVSIIYTRIHVSLKTAALGFVSCCTSSGSP